MLVGFASRVDSHSSSATRPGPSPWRTKVVFHKAGLQISPSVLQSAEASSLLHLSFRFFKVLRPREEGAGLSVE